MSKQMSRMLIFVGIFFTLVFGWYAVKKGIFYYYMSHYKPPAATVTATATIKKEWQPFLTAVGTLSAINGVDLTAEISGIVQEVRFKSGEFVKQGDVLVLLRTLSEEANLKSNQAKLQLAKMNYEREKTLFNKKVSSQSALDKRYAELQEAIGGVEATQAQIQQKTIIAPFDGRLGIRQINLGQFISPGTPIVTLQSLDPLYVMFNLPEQYLANLSIGQKIDVSINYGNGLNVSGKIVAINSKVEQSTRNILVQAMIPNDKYQLYPGMYASVKIWMNNKKNEIVIPQTAITYSLSGDYVFIVKNEGTANEPLLRVYRQYVKIGERRDNEASIIDGLKLGDKIVTSGQLKLQNGTQVSLDDSVQL